MDSETVMAAASVSTTVEASDLKMAAVKVWATAAGSEMVKVLVERKVQERVHR